MRQILELPFADVIRTVQENLKDYRPTPIRRVHIPKPGKAETRPLGIPNILNAFDWSIAKAWEEKPTRFPYTAKSNKIQALRKQGKLKPAYLIRYCDDWVLITDTKANAEKWKKRLQNYLQTRLNLTLSEEKTKITCVKKSPIEFLGFTYKVMQSGTARKGHVSRTRPNLDRLKNKISEVRKQVKRIGKCANLDLAVCQIHRVNSIIRGLINYYQAATLVNSDLAKYAWDISRLAYREIEKLGGKWVPAHQTNNLMAVHSQYLSMIPAVEYYNRTIGVTSLRFCKWTKTKLKNQDENPYTPEGRERYQKRTGKRQALPRNDELLGNHLIEKIARNRGSPRYNFEFFMNRGYALNRDKGKCRICNIELNTANIELHHLQEHLPLKTLNRVPNLASVCKACHMLIHSNWDNLKLTKAIQNKLSRMRKKVELRLR